MPNRVTAALCALAIPALLCGACGSDRLNAIAPAAIKADFGRFARLEHDLLDPGHAGPPAVPDARTFAALRRVQSYLHSTCGLPG